MEENNRKINDIVSDESLAKTSTQAKTLTEEELRLMDIDLLPYEGGYLFKVNTRIGGNNFPRIYGCNWESTFDKKKWKENLFPSKQIALISISFRIKRGEIL